MKEKPKADKNFLSLKHAVGITPMICKVVPWLYLNRGFYTSFSTSWHIHDMLPLAIIVFYSTQQSNCFVIWSQVVLRAPQISNVLYIKEVFRIYIYMLHPSSRLSDSCDVSLTVILMIIIVRQILLGTETRHKCRHRRDKPVHSTICMPLCNGRLSHIAMSHCIICCDSSDSISRIKLPGWIVINNSQRCCFGNYYLQFG